MSEGEAAEVTRYNGERAFNEQAFEMNRAGINALGRRGAGNLDVAAQVRAEPVGREDAGKALENAGSVSASGQSAAISVNWLPSGISMWRSSA